VAGFCEYGDEPSGSGTTELVIKSCKSNMGSVFKLMNINNGGKIHIIIHKTY
jgi:hypothetical protein